MTGVGKYIIIFLESDVIVKMILICLGRMAVLVILNVLEKWATSIIHWTLWYLPICFILF